MSLILTDTPTTVAALHRHYEKTAADWRREHLGASVLGNKCDRFVWLAFRWAGAPTADGRILRLFERGRREESWLVDDLRAIGVQVWDTDPATGEQWRVRWGHVGGSADGIVQGLLESAKRAVFESKTINLKKLTKLKAEGLKRANVEHFVQVQLYMHGLGLERAFYVAVCKDNDEIYSELVSYDAKFAAAQLARGVAISLAAEPPERQTDSEFPPCVYTSKDGTRWPCRFLNQCFGNEWPLRSCRTCVHVTPKENGTWRCEKHGRALDLDAQRAGCSSHATIPSMTMAQVVDVDPESGRITFQQPDGQQRTEGA